MHLSIYISTQSVGGVTFSLLPPQRLFFEDLSVDGHSHWYEVFHQWGFDLH